MKLKEKLFNTVFDNAWAYKHENTIPELEKIANEFAIGFAKWLLNERTGFNRETEIKELLEIYKQGL
jgi:hypothetical protein